MVSRAALLVLAVSLVAAPALAQRVCEEELAGTCLKWRDEAPTRAAPAPEPTPAPPSPEAAAERALGLDADARRRVQTALNRGGFEAGMADGAFGSQTRRAIARWQRARGRAPTGYLSTGDAEALNAAAAPPAPQAAPAAPPPPQKAAPAPAPEPEPEPAIRRAEARHGASRFAVTVKPGADGPATLTLRMTTPNRTEPFEQSCPALASGAFECGLTQSGWTRVRVEGALPEITLRFDPRTLVSDNPNAQDSPGYLTLTLP